MIATPRFILAFVGDAVPIAEHVGFIGAAGFFSATMNVLVYRTAIENQFTWFDRQGKALDRAGEFRSFGGVDGLLRISPDGARYSVDQLATGNYDIWATEFARGVTTRLTFDNAIDTYALWSHDGRQILFRSNRNGVFDIFQKGSDGTGIDALVLHTDREKLPTDWSHNGRYVIYQEMDADKKEDLWLLPMEGDRKPLALTHTRDSRPGCPSPCFPCQAPPASLISRFTPADNVC